MRGPEGRRTHRLPAPSRDEIRIPKARRFVVCQVLVVVITVTVAATAKDFDDSGPDATFPWCGHLLSSSTHRIVDKATRKKASLSTTKSPSASSWCQKKRAVRSFGRARSSSFAVPPTAAPTKGPVPLLTLPTSASPPVHSIPCRSNPSLSSRPDRGVAASESASLGVTLGTRATLQSTPFVPEHVPIHQVDDYMLIRRLGAGKFSDVFEALHVPAATCADTSAADDFPWGNRHSNQTLDDRHLVVVKCLKPVSERKIRREIRMLCRTQSLPNVVRLLAVVVPEQDDANGACDDLETVPVPRMPALILSHAGPQAQWLCHPHQVRDHPTTTSPMCRVNDANVSAPSSMSLYLTDYEIRYYLCHLLVALEALHANQIMHRDVKPRNVLINRRYPVSESGPQQQRRRQRPLVLIDLGLADVVVPGQAYNVRVASRHFKSPELLLNYRSYGPPIDLWGVGCILAGLLLRREPFFRGKDNVDQLQRIAAVLGTQDLCKYIKKYAIAVPDDMRWALEFESVNSTGTSRRLWSEFIGSPVRTGVDSDSPVAFQPRHLLPTDGLDLLDRLLVYDHEARWTATQAIQHEYFDMVRNRVRLEVKMYP
jgi:casein kinase II subunit alpha